MALVKAEIVVANLQFVRDDAGVLVDVLAEITFVVKDDVSNERYGRSTRAVSIWADLTATQRTALSGIASKISQLAASKV